LYDIIASKMGDAMPRIARLHSNIGIYHIMLRGNEKKDIFYDDEDRARFVETLIKMKADGNYQVYAYCLMDNHVHLLVKEKNDTIYRIMKRICVSYVYYFNNKYQRIGHLFQDRFRSEATEKESYILAAARYIHNNPVKAGIVKKAENYVWSSYKEYMGEKTYQPGMVDKGFLLSLFSDSEERAIELFKDFTKQLVEDKFIDFDESSAREKIIDADRRSLKEQINGILLNRGYHLESINSCTEKRVRNELIREIRETTGASVRELSRIMGIGKDIIFRA
jgi:REP element-mobilizing transposase RayT